ncbi:universal stress protein [Actinoplanes sp. L3-i22]|nr:universal stress protein [Actinoplanes sp. L3-i22]
MVGVDGTLTSTVTVDLAATEAARRGCRLLIVHAWPGRYRGRFRIRGPHHGQAEGSGLLAQAAAHATAAGAGPPVETRMSAGLPADVLAVCSHDAELVVIGHRDGQLDRLDWGSTARALARICHCPLLVHRGRFDAHGPVVVGVSARPGEPALGYAFAQAAQTGADLVAVHAWRRPAGRAGRHPLPIEAEDPQRRAVADALAAALAALSWQLPQVAVRPLVVPDLDVPYTLDRASRRARLLVAGTGGRGELTDLLGPADGRRRGHHGLCPVVLIPPGWTVEPPTGADPPPAHMRPRRTGRPARPGGT